MASLNGWAMQGSGWNGQSGKTGLSANFHSEVTWLTGFSEQFLWIEKLFDGTVPWLLRHVKSRQCIAGWWAEYLECSEQIRGGRKSHSDLPFQWKWSKWLISELLTSKSHIFLLSTGYKGSPRRFLGHNYQQHWRLQNHAKEAIQCARGATE